MKHKIVDFSSLTCNRLRKSQQILEYSIGMYQICKLQGIGIRYAPIVFLDIHSYVTILLILVSSIENGLEIQYKIKHRIFQLTFG